MSYQLTLLDLPSVTSSLELECGLTHCATQDGLTTDLFGREVVLANLSARQAREMGLLTSGTYGPRSSTLSASAALSRLLASKLQVVTAGLGSTLYRLTWKEWVTPAGRPIPALRASVPRTSVNDSTGWLLVGWNTPVSVPQTKTCHGQCSGKLKNEVRLAGWATPLQSDSQKIKPFHNSPQQCVAYQAHLAGWPTPAQTDHKGGYQGGRIRNGKLSTDRLDVTAQLAGPARLTASGTLLTGSCAEMASGGQLNPPPEPLADGIAHKLGYSRIEGRYSLNPLQEKAENRVMRLRGYGNAIVAPQAEAFIRACMEVV